LNTLEELDLSNNKIEAIPKEIQNLKNLVVLKLDNNPIREIHDNIKFLSRLRHLSLSNTFLEKLPSIFQDLKSLEHLRLDNLPFIFTKDFEGQYSGYDNFPQGMFLNFLTQPCFRTIIPIDVDGIWVKQLSTLFSQYDLDSKGELDEKQINTFNQTYLLDSTKFPRFKRFPMEICQLVNIKHLEICNWGIESVPSELSNLTGLEHLNLSNNIKLRTLPKEISSLCHLKELILTNNNELMQPPQEIICKGIESILNYLKSLPSS